MMLWDVKSPKALKQNGHGCYFSSVQAFSHILLEIYLALTNPCGSPVSSGWAEAGGERRARGAPWREV